MITSGSAILFEYLLFIDLEVLFIVIKTNVSYWMQKK